MNKDRDDNEDKDSDEDVDGQDGEDGKDDIADENLCVKDVGPSLHLPVVLHLRQKLWQRLRAIHPCRRNM